MVGRKTDWSRKGNRVRTAFFRPINVPTARRGEEYVRRGRWNGCRLEESLEGGPRKVVNGFEVELACQSLDDSALCLLPKGGRGGSAQLARNAGHHDISDSAGYDQIEVAEIGADVESKAMECDPLLHVNPDAGNLASARPNASESRIRSCYDAQLCQRTDQSVLEATQIPVKVLTMLPQIDNGVTHKLAGTVVGHVAAALHLEHRYTAALQHRSTYG